MKFKHPLLLTVGLFFISSFCLAQSPDVLLEEFYETGVMYESEALKMVENIQADLEEQLSVKEKENLIVLYLEYALLLSSYYAGSTDAFPTYLETIDDYSKNFVTTSLCSVPICFAYADFLYSKLAWANGQDMLTVLEGQPFLYRRALLLLKDSKDEVSKSLRIEALTKLALWYAFPADVSTVNWSVFIAQQENNIEKLKKVDRFNAYITMSMYYMNAYQVQTGWNYLEKAKKIFPENTLPLIIKENYLNGNFGW